MWLDRISSFISRYRGLPTMIAVVMVLLNFAFRLMDLGWLSDSDLFLHLGIVVGFIGLLLSAAIK